MRVCHSCKLLVLRNCKIDHCFQSFNVFEDDNNNLLCTTNLCIHNGISYNYPKESPGGDSVCDNYLH